MTNTLFRSIVPAVAALVLLAANGCRDRPESNADEGAEAVPEQEPSEAVMAGEAESGDAEGAEEGDERREGGEEGEHREGGEHEGDREGGEHGEGGEEGEESGEYIDRTQRWDAARRGIRLTLSFDEGESAFAGTVENTTQATICSVRVEVHLSNGTELGPTEPADLEPGESATVLLPSEGAPFERWTAHPEASPCGIG